jgi:hypothetical protein
MVGKRRRQSGLGNRRRDSWQERELLDSLLSESEVVVQDLLSLTDASR